MSGASKTAEAWAVQCFAEKDEVSGFVGFTKEKFELAMYAVSAEAGIPTVEELTNAWNEFAHDGLLAAEQYIAIIGQRRQHFRAQGSVNEEFTVDPNPFTVLGADKEGLVRGLQVHTKGRFLAAEFEKISSIDGLRQMASYDSINGDAFRKKLHELATQPLEPGESAAL
jgi:hypothetical protein